MNKRRTTAAERRQLREAADRRRVQATAMRRAVKHIPEAWVRVWTDGVMWAGSHRQTPEAMLEVKRALEAAGFHCECGGCPGTVGEYILDVDVLT